MLGFLLFIVDISVRMSCSASWMSSLFALGLSIQICEPISGQVHQQAGTRRRSITRVLHIWVRGRSLTARERYEQKWRPPLEHSNLEALTLNICGFDAIAQRYMEQYAHFCRMHHFILTSCPSWRNFCGSFRNSNSINPIRSRTHERGMSRRTWREQSSPRS